MNTSFSRVVGQKNALNQLRFFLEGFKRTGIMTNILFMSAKGLGKSMLCKELCREMYLERKKAKVKRPMVEVTCGSIKSVDEFLNRIILPHVGSEVSFSFEESHSISRKVTDVLLTMLNPNTENKNVIRYNNEDIVVDFKKWSFFFSTTDVQLMASPLRDRLEEVSLEPYSQSDLAAIIRMSSLNYDVSDEACIALASFSRGNARSATKISSNLIKFMEVKGVKRFENAHVKDLTRVLNLFPLGLQRVEVELLKYMSEQTEISLNGLSARSGLGRTAIQNLENYLVKNNLVSIKAKRMVTAAGQKYLKECNL